MSTDSQNPRALARGAVKVQQRGYKCHKDGKPVFNPAHLDDGEVQRTARNRPSRWSGPSIEPASG